MLPGGPRALFELRRPVITTPPLEIPSLPPVPYGPRVNWYGMAGEVARSLTRAQPRRLHPGSGEHPRSPYVDCKPQPRFAWDPEPHAVGLIHHWLPYLRLGRRCVVTLGFFSCNLGELPEPNGHLFDALRDRKAIPPPDVPYWRDAEPRGLCR